MNFQNDLIFVRHAESIGNTVSQDERAELNTPNHKYNLTPNGQAQAVLAGKCLRGFVERQSEKYLKNYRVLRVFQSTFVRSQETLSIILEQLGVEVAPITDSRLDEKWDGIFHELTKREIEEKYPEQIRLRKRSGYYHYRAPGGESCPDVELRIRSFIESDLLKQGEKQMSLGWEDFNADGCDIVVCHGRWFQIFQKYFHGMSVDQFLHIKEESRNPNCSITIYSAIGKTLVDCVNPWEGVIAENKNTFA